MTVSAWIALAFGAIGVVVNLAAFLVAYGVLKGTLMALCDRVTALEGELSTLADLKVAVGKIETTVGFVHEQFKELNASIRWMRSPSDHDAAPLRGARGPRSKA